jgi:putative flippase GtrA
MSKTEDAVSPPDGPASATSQAWHRRLIALALKLGAFAIAGGSGFAIDMLATHVLIYAGLGGLLARACGIAIAMVVTYAINRGLTFRAEASTGTTAVAAEGARYGLVAVATSILNWAVFAGVILLWPGTPTALAITAGSLVAMVASYVGFDRFAFRKAGSA